MSDRRFSFYTKEQSLALLDKLAREREQNFDYVKIESVEVLNKWVAKIEAESCFVALDTETRGLKPAPGMVKTIQLAYSENQPVLIIELPKIENRTSLERLMSNTRLLKVGHNLKFDVLMLEAEGIMVRGPVMCTMLGIEVLKAGATRQASLQFTAKDLLNIRLNKSEQKSNWSGSLSLAQLQYAANDAGILIEIIARLQQRLDEAGLTKIAILEYCCLLPIIKMQKRGIYLDRDRWQKVRQTYQSQRDKLVGEIYKEDRKSVV